MNRQVNVRVTENEYKALQELSHREMRTISQTIRLFIRRYMPDELVRARAQHAERQKAHEEVGS
jgi:hypothetical protein